MENQTKSYHAEIYEANKVVMIWWALGKVLFKKLNFHEYNMSTVKDPYKVTFIELKLNFTYQKAKVR